MKTVTTKEKQTELLNKLAADPQFHEYVEKVADQYLPLVLARAREMARELALFGICTSQIVTEINWRHVLDAEPPLGEPFVGEPKLQLVDPRHILLLGTKKQNELQDTTRTSPDPKN